MEYKPEFDNMAYIACRNGGFTDNDLADLFSVVRSTISKWKNDHETFKAAILKGKDEFDTSTAEGCLLKKITGYDFTEVKEVYDDIGKLIECIKTTKHVPSSDTAIIFFLKNRNSKRWREIKAIEVGNLDDKPFKADDIKKNMSAKEAQALYEEMLKDDR
jgi:hypothetical protein